MDCCSKSEGSPEKRVFSMAEADSQETKYVKRRRAYDDEEAAARAYDLAAIKYWGPSTYTNFPVSDYDKEIEIMQNLTREEYLASLRSWILFDTGEAVVLQEVYPSTEVLQGTQEEAAHAYDIAAIEYRGINAVTNFDLSTYIRWLRPADHNSENATHQADSNYMINLNIEPNNTANSFAIKNPAISQKHEIIERKMPLSPGNKAMTSPTALGLLLRSSLFKELVEKTATTSTTTAVAAVCNNEKDDKLEGRGGEDDEEVVFYNGNDRCGVTNHAAKGESVSSDENGSPLYNIQTGPLFWNAV
ncbi:hypothetical protein DH2020_020338 [Rehmannia glutinosa]|uniref:AP2/ERF domain-containing protein n=1 Tax=Rehmannia glutinosa TaxID=99300 RepID=A0ABR0WHB9_REHGL